MDSQKTLLFYILVIIVAFILTYLGNKFKNKKIELFKIFELSYDIICNSIVFFILWSILTFADCGADLNNYQHIFYTLEITEVEFGFELWNLFIRIFTSKYIIYNAITSFVMLLLYFKGFKYYEKYAPVHYQMLIFLSIFYFQMLNLKRIALAGAIIFYAFYYFLEGDIKKFVIFALLACSIHYTAISVFLFVAIYYLFKNNVKKGVLLSLFVAILLFYNLDLFKYFLVDRYANYEIIEAHLGFFGLFSVGLPIILFMINEDKENKFEVFGCLCSTALLIITILCYKIIILGRLNYYFLIVFIVFYPYLINKVKNKVQSILKTGIIFCLIFILSYKSYSYFTSMLESDGIQEYRIYQEFI